MAWRHGLETWIERASVHEAMGLRAMGLHAMGLPYEPCNAPLSDGDIKRCCDSSRTFARNGPAEIERVTATYRPFPFLPVSCLRRA
jgi:hypothetical protein